MQLDWLMQLELLLKDVFELAKLSEDSYCEFYNQTLLRIIKSFFPYTMCEELSIELSGSVKNKMEQLYDYVISKRTTVQDMLKDSDIIAVSESILIVAVANLSQVSILDLKQLQEMKSAGFAYS